MLSVKQGGIKYLPPWVFGMTWIEPQSPGLLANTLLIWLIVNSMNQFMYKHFSGSIKIYSWTQSKNQIFAKIYFGFVLHENSWLLHFVIDMPP